jgi:hypothetical protein
MAWVKVRSCYWGFIDVANFNARLMDFQKFLNKTDYDVLYKASRMDFEILQQDINLKMASLNHQYE